MRKWYAFFSQTGSEIYQVSKLLGRFPDRIITNRRLVHTTSPHPDAAINKDLLLEYKGNWVFMPQKPSALDYVDAMGVDTKVFNESIVTLHGYLRIVPEVICNTYNIYNGHPGDIVHYPELKGFNPQEKAFNLKLPTSGSVIHKVIAGVDEGEVVANSDIRIEGMSLDEVYKNLHSNSVKLWYTFLRNYFP